MANPMAAFRMFDQTLDPVGYVNDGVYLALRGLGGNRRPQPRNNDGAGPPGC